MTRAGRWALLVALLLLCTPARAQSPRMRAPDAEELDRRSEDWIRSRRWMALIIIGGTLAAGAGASVVRRRNRRKAQPATPSPGPPDWPASGELLGLDPPLRMDRLRKALRAGATPPPPERAGLEELFAADDQAALRVLVLEALAATDAGVDRALLERARHDPADSVRGAALQLLLEREPERAVALARDHLDDPGVEVRALAADVLAPVDAEAAGRAMLDLVRAEALGPRESHALRRAMGFFAEELRDPAWAARIASLREEVEDPEGMIDWALAELAALRS